MGSRGLTLLFLAGLTGSVGTSLTADGPATIQFVDTYTGPHPNEFNDLLAQVKVIVPAALAYITGQWGLPNQLHYPLIVRIDDIPNRDRSRAMAAYVRSSRSGNELRQQLVVDLSHHLMYPDENLDNLLYHEMAHAILQDAVTTPVAAGIPQWFNEGLAQSVTTEGHERTGEDFKRYGHTDAHAVICDLNGKVDVFYHGEYNYGCYTYFFLAIQRLLSKGGKDAVAKVVDALHSGMPLPLVIGRVTGMNWPAFQRDAEQYAKDVFSGKEAIP